MRLDTLLLADHAVVSEGKLYVNGGGVTRFNVPSLPMAISNLSVVLRMLTDERDYGDHLLLLEFLNPDDVQTLPPEPAIVTVPPKPSASAEGEEYYTQVVMSFGGMPLLRSGLHRFRVSWDEKLIRELHLPVVIVDTPVSPLGRGAPPPARTPRKSGAGQ